jgi:hypothetical protein
LHHFPEIGFVKKSLIKKKPGGNGLMAPGTRIMKGLPDQFGRTTRTLLKRKGRIKGLPTGTGTLALAGHL